MWMPNISILVAGVVGVLLLLVKESESLECYYCSGNTYFDPDSCFNPNEDRTFIQECRRKDEVCEKKLVRIDGWTQKVERGCSPNCQGRAFIWTADFKVHCCNGDRCNGASNSIPTSISTGIPICLSVHIIFNLLYYVTKV